MGLTPEGGADDAAMDLPLHPKLLELELKSHKEYLERLKQYQLQLEHKHLFANAILAQDPKPTKHDLDDFERSNFVLQEQLLQTYVGIDKIKAQLARDINNTTIELEQMKARSDEVFTIVDDIEETDKVRERLQQFLKQMEHTRTREEAKAILDKQQNELADVTRTLDEHSERVAELDFLIEDEENDVKALELKLHQMSARAKQAIDRSATKDPQIEEPYRWYCETARHFYTVSGIRNVTTDYDHDITVEYTTDDKLTFYMDRLTSKIATIAVSNPNIDISDLQVMARDHNVDDIGYTVVLEVLTRVTK
ncbi:hypothetical protein BC940DRAFT_323670 [Gongronella butleri]|nr:hypothetical protein BC940DRAFT_323670 [Gongronella butleri]